ncbi:unnamed protein product [Enterobius vermicularis]|uniref:Integrase_H2C2 domain-containing protein n=1 Tax=Enterobius vermicularis TaxID=51028 RepID=A0A0N4V490_ENTVE|nr:unnamed protein product [Enterobius vermicularis]
MKALVKVPTQRKKEKSASLMAIKKPSKNKEDNTELSEKKEELNININRIRKTDKLLDHSDTSGHLRLKISNGKYVPSEDSPTDIGSRRCTPNESKNNDHWWSGPDWLNRPSNDAFYWKPPVYLPNDNILKHMHARILHTRSSLREYSWFKKGRQTVSKISRKECYYCRRWKLKLFKLPIMCSLPIERVISSRTLEHVGLDYIEPINVDIRGKLESITSDNAPQFIALAKNYSIK